mgnify:CR=1 FL=1
MSIGFRAGARFGFGGNHGGGLRRRLQAETAPSNDHFPVTTRIAFGSTL